MNIDMRDVGHGLKVIINNNLMVDCGSINHTRYMNEFTHCSYCKNITTFMLSHFHNDHYNGVSNLPSLENVSKVYLPGIPNYTSDPTVFIDLYSLMLSISSITTGKLTLLNLLSIFKKKSLCPPVSVELLYNDRRCEKLVSRSTEEYDILWPPRNLVNSHTLAKLVRKVLTNFSDNMTLRDVKDIKQLQALYKTILNDLINGINILTDDYYQKISYEKLNQFLARNLESLTINTLDELEKINNVLATLGDRLSLAFSAKDNNKILLFFSDQDPTRIKNIIDEIGIVTTPHNIDILIPPHHGTRWHSEMLKLNTENTIISCSRTQSSKKYYKLPNLCKITTNLPEETHNNGSIRKIL